MSRQSLSVPGDRVAVVTEVGDATTDPDRCERIARTRLVRLTGGRGVRSGVFSEDAHDVGHGFLPVDPVIILERWGAS